MGQSHCKLSAQRDAPSAESAFGTSAERIPPARLCAGNGASGPPVKAGMSETLSGTVLLHLKPFFFGLGFFVYIEIILSERNV